MPNSKDVVVTGVSTGIGWGTTKVLVSNGFRVFGSVRKQADADRLQREFGNGFVPLMMDITDADAPALILRRNLRGSKKSLAFVVGNCLTEQAIAFALAVSPRGIKKVAAKIDRKL